MLLSPKPPNQRCSAIEKRERIRGYLTTQTELPTHELMVIEIRMLAQYKVLETSTAPCLRLP
jgi:hypothetical protein